MANKKENIEPTMRDETDREVAELIGKEHTLMLRTVKWHSAIFEANRTMFDFLHRRANYKDKEGNPRYPLAVIWGIECLQATAKDVSYHIGICESPTYEIEQQVEEIRKALDLYQASRGDNSVIKFTQPAPLKMLSLINDINSIFSQSLDHLVEMLQEKPSDTPLQPLYIMGLINEKLITE